MEMFCVILISSLAYVVDEERSCTVTASADPTHIVPSPSVQRIICGTEYQPWIIVAHVGEKIGVTLIDFVTRQLTGERSQHCRMYGTIIDKYGKRTISICGNELEREKSLYNSTGNTLHIKLYSNIERISKIGDSIMFILILKAFGCADIIPPEDSWLKRNGDTIVIGCYSGRQTWRLICLDDKWVGTIGSCTHDNETPQHSVTVSILYASSLRKKEKAKRAKTKVTFAPNYQDAVLHVDTGDANIQPQRIARVLPISYREPAVTSSMPNILSNDLESGFAFPYLIPKESDYATACLDLAESYQRRMPTRSRKRNSTSGYLLPNELRSQIRRHEYLDLVDDDSIHSSVRALHTDPEPGHLTPNKFKPLSRAHDYLDLVDDTTLPREGPRGFNHRKLLPTGFRIQSRQHEYLDLIDYDPNRSSLRRCQSDSFSEYLVPSELREQVYANDYMHLVERDFDRPTVYAFLKPSSAAASIPTKNPRK